MSNCTTAIQIKTKHGDTRRHTFIIKDVNGVVVDISAWSAFKLDVHSDKNPTDDTTLLESMTGQLSTDGTDGRVSFIRAGTIEPTSTAYYDAKADDSNSESTTFATGSYEVVQDRTK